MGSMNTQLMRASRNGIEAYARATIYVALNLKYCMCRTTIFGDHLTRAVLIVEF